MQRTSRRSRRPKRRSTYASPIPQRFAELKAIKEQGVADPLLARQITVLYLEYLAKQVDHELLKKMPAKSNAVERAFNVFRPKVDGKELTDNDIRRILRESRDSAERRAAWEASKKVGPVVVGDLLELVALRNEAARKLGFANYARPATLLRRTEPRASAQAVRRTRRTDPRAVPPGEGRDRRRAGQELRHHGGRASSLALPRPVLPGGARPCWATCPSRSTSRWTRSKLCRSFYDGIGLPVDEVLKRSSLYEQPGKNPHAFCIDIDRRATSACWRTSCRAGNGWPPRCTNWATRCIPKTFRQSLPYMLHTDAHPLCTEGVAMMFERFAQNVDWLRAMGAEVSNPEQFRAAAAKLRRNRLLVFSRYCQVMFRFEMALYANPKQDLNRLWWDLVEKYQEIKRPEGRNEPDYASKYHLIGAPVYYHNYMLGEMFASQVHHALVRRVLPGVKPAGAIYVGNKAAGTFMKQRVFEPGLTLNWNDLTRHATGEPLNPKALAEDLGAAN